MGEKTRGTSSAPPGPQPNGPMPKCSAHRTDGSKCSAYAMRGTTVCWFHGGANPGVAQASADRAVVARVQEMMAKANTYGGAVAISPTEALMQELYRTNGHVLWLQEMILTSAPEELAESFWLYSRSVDSNSVTARDFDGLRSFAGVWLKLYAAERSHLLKVAESCHRMGIEDRYIKLAEQQVEMVYKVIMATLRTLGFDVTDKRVPQIIEAEIRSLAESGETELMAVKR